ncbi:fibronectin type III domain-containing protein [Nautilia lithotrophica]
MKKINKIFVILFLVNFLFATSSIPEKYRTLNVVSDGKGTLRFRWYVPPRYWSEKGWVLLCDNKEVKKIAFSKKMIYFIKLLKNSKMDQKNQNALNIELFKIFMDFDLAVKDGLAAMLNVKKIGKCEYILKVKGSRDIIIKSKPIDAYKATPLPTKPVHLTAKNTKKGISLFWNPPKNKENAPFAYKIYRKKPDNTWRLLTKPFLVTGIKWDKKRALYTDVYAPLEKKVTYKVEGIDIFNRISKPAFISIYHPDKKALIPPSELKAIPINKGVKLTWKPSVNPLVYGYIIERGEWAEGFFTLLTKEPLTRNVSAYVDKTAKEGVSYIYRIRSVNLKGKIGKPSNLANVVVSSDKTPQKAGYLKAKVYPNMVKLTWQKVKGDILGYIIEKKYEGYEKWVALNDIPVKDNYYDDIFAYNAAGAVFYRLISINMSGNKSEPSKAVQVKLPGHLPVYAPDINKITFKKGKIIIDFEVSNTGQKPNKIIVYRGLIDDVKGKPVAEVNPKEKSFFDTDILYGKTYWYALQAVSKTKEKSKLSQKYLVKTYRYEIPIPPKPKLTYFNKPFKYVKIEFNPPVKNLGITIYSKEKNQSIWLKKASNVKGNFFIDTDIPSKGEISYKIVYNTPSLMEGQASQSTNIVIK